MAGYFKVATTSNYEEDGVTVLYVREEIFRETVRYMVEGPDGTFTKVDSGGDVIWTIKILN